MSFIRPEAQEALRRWRFALSGAALAALGVYCSLGFGGLVGWIGWPLAGAGVALGVVGIQRARFDTGHDGPGVVEIDEGEITYYGPLNGGSVSTGEIERLILDPTSRPPCWVMVDRANGILQVPVNADGADELFEAFAALPGLRTSRLLSELRSGMERKGGIPTVIWERHAETVDRRRLN
ncbi:hypothetical protein [Chachezhania sediminis]|uniref:hypothetical protein n=1 Tax=Chachezhania sediminis TaxID=2599291 RepID=UPI00131C5BDF|nr:hypothetical protein [Chachezhania sediminis]